MKFPELENSAGRPSPSMVVAVIALIVALGGTSYAATKLSRNSVGTKQIKNNAVTAKKIKKNAVSAKQIKKNSVNSSKVKARSLVAGDFKKNSLPKGPRGATGPPGPIEGTPAGGDLTGTYPDPALAAFPAARAKASTEQTVPNGAVTALNLDEETFDTGDMYVAPDDQITVKKRGTYMLGAQLGWSADPTGTGVRQLRIQAGGSLNAFDQATPGLTAIRQSVSGSARLSPGDVVSLVAYQTSGSDLNTNVNPGMVGGAWLSVVWAGP